MNNLLELQKILLSHEADRNELENKRVLINKRIDFIKNEIDEIESYNYNLYNEVNKLILKLYFYKQAQENKNLSEDEVFKEWMKFAEGNKKEVVKYIIKAKDKIFNVFNLRGMTIEYIKEYMEEVLTDM